MLRTTVFKASSISSQISSQPAAIRKTWAAGSVISSPKRTSYMSKSLEVIVGLKIFEILSPSANDVLLVIE